MREPAAAHAAAESAPRAGPARPEKLAVVSEDVCEQRGWGGVRGRGFRGSGEGVRGAMGVADKELRSRHARLGGLHQTNKYAWHSGVEGGMVREGGNGTRLCWCCRADVAEVEQACQTKPAYRWHGESCTMHGQRGSMSQPCVWQATC
jgi:hypothetical protein